MRLPEIVALCLCIAACASGAGRDEQKTASVVSTRLSSPGRMNLGLAQGYVEANELAKASERLKLAMASDPGSAEVHAMAAIIHDRSGEAGKAEREFDRALAIAPTDGFILNAHASWLCENGHAAQADQEFTRALADPRYRMPFQTLANAGKCAHQQRQWAKAESYLRRAAELSPSDATVLQLLADSELRQGKFMEARAFIQRRDALGPDAATLELAAAIEEAAGDRLSAARYRQRLKEQFPDPLPTGEGARKP